MSGHPLLAFTADLHWGHGGRGDDAVLSLAAFLTEQPPDVLVLAGDIGTGPFFAECLQLFSDVPCKKAVVPGNHDIWVHAEENQPDSLQLYRDELPRIAAQCGFEYLDHGPLYLPDADLAVVGSMNWYDYSWAAETLRRQFPDEVYRLQSKRFTRGRHNDANFVRWALDDATFTSQVVDAFEFHLQAALERVGRVIVVTHHPPFPGIGFPRSAGPLVLDELLWEAFAGNQRLQDVLEKQAGRIEFAFCGHTHRAREGRLGAIRGYNIGGDYHFKRLLLLDWPSRTVEGHHFGNPERGA
jgi:predicted phosphohydrolase